MSVLASVPQTEVALRFDRPLPGPAGQRARQLRGALATAFIDDHLFHQHDPITGKLIYRYPRVQYRWQQAQGGLVAWGEQAAQRLVAKEWSSRPLRLGQDEVVITDAALTCRAAEFGLSERLLHYRFQTPALLFNAENFKRYRTLDERAQQAERDRLLVANLLIALRGLDVRVPDRLYASFSQPRLQPSRYKGEKLLGLTGDFISNAMLPDSFACGHAVSHGFGVIASI